jgi:hypothetical protein
MAEAEEKARLKREKEEEKERLKKAAEEERARRRAERNEKRRLRRAELKMEKQRLAAEATATAAATAAKLAAEAAAAAAAASQVVPEVIPSSTEAPEDDLPAAGTPSSPSTPTFPFFVGDQMAAADDDHVAHPLIQAAPGVYLSAGDGGGFTITNASSLPLVVALEDFPPQLVDTQQQEPLERSSSSTSTIVPPSEADAAGGFTSLA